MSTATRRYADLTTAEVADALGRDSVLVLPTGAIEPHGPHLPLSTDLIMAESIAAEVVDRGAAAGHDVWLLPALAYTKSDEHARLPGTMAACVDSSGNSHRSGIGHVLDTGETSAGDQCPRW